MIKYLDKEDFMQTINNKTILVDFYADWCGPCQMMGEILENLNIDIDILKVNTDSHQEIANKYGIMSIPTLILFKDGKEVGKLIGLQSQDDILKFINN